MTARQHPFAASEVRHWLAKHAFEVLAVSGDRQGRPYTTEGERAIFRARKA